jgi:hypothetical protein
MTTSWPSIIETSPIGGVPGCITPFPSVAGWRPRPVQDPSVPDYGRGLIAREGFVRRATDGTDSDPSLEWRSWLPSFQHPGALVPRECHLGRVARARPPSQPSPATFMAAKTAKREEREAGLSRQMLPVRHALGRAARLLEISRPCGDACRADRGFTDEFREVIYMVDGLIAGGDVVVADDLGREQHLSPSRLEPRLNRGVFRCRVRAAAKQETRASCSRVIGRHGPTRQRFPRRGAPRPGTLATFCVWRFKFWLDR